MKKLNILVFDVLIEQTLFFGNLRFLIHIMPYVVVNPEVLLNIIVHTAS